MQAARVWLVYSVASKTVPWLHSTLRLQCHTRKGFVWGAEDAGCCGMACLRGVEDVLAVQPAAVRHRKRPGFRPSCVLSHRRARVGVQRLRRRHIKHPACAVLHLLATGDVRQISPLWIR